MVGRGRKAGRPGEAPGWQGGRVAGCGRRVRTYGVGMWWRGGVGGGSEGSAGFRQCRFPVLGQLTVAHQPATANLVTVPR